MLTTGLAAAVRHWRQTPRWPYVLLALLAFPFIGHAYEDAGVVIGGLYAGVTVLGLVQAIRPTILGWALLFLVLLSYALLGVSDEVGPVRQGLEVLLVIAVVGGAFWFIRPWKPWPGHRAG